MFTIFKRVYYVEGLNHNAVSRLVNSVDADFLELHQLKLMGLMASKAFSSGTSITSPCSQRKEVVTGLPKFQSEGSKFASLGRVWSMRVACINGKKYIWMIVDDYSRSLGSFFYGPRKRQQKFSMGLHSSYFKEEGIEHQTSTPQTPEQNGVVERRNRTLVEAARTMLSASKLPLSLWAEAVATACYNQNRSIIYSTHEKDGIISPSS
ncbi:reverse transcriptase domain-containing protein [Tanacetum coccineum]|uniref:Reverse transcriptase domain-containing protein n=1 Tax=Tanacetum coccineum TaxID=301880 RepID=A0ABQ5GYA2_9ASTR